MTQSNIEDRWMNSRNPVLSSHHRTADGFFYGIEFVPATPEITSTNMFRPWYSRRTPQDNLYFMRDTEAIIEFSMWDDAYDFLAVEQNKFTIAQFNPGWVQEKNDWFNWLVKTGQISAVHAMEVLALDNTPIDENTEEQVESPRDMPQEFHSDFTLDPDACVDDIDPWYHPVIADDHDQTDFVERGY